MTNAGISTRLFSGVVALLSLITCVDTARALDPNKALTQYVHTAWRTDDGLPQNSVTAILETKDGFLWVGTQAGLARFDGVRFQTFNHTNTPAFRDDFITELLEDTDGTLWIGTWGDGLIKYREGRFSRLSSVGPRAAMRLALDPAGNLWAGGDDGLTQLRKGAAVRTYKVGDGLSSNLVRSIVAAKDGTLWVGTKAGLNRLKEGKIDQFYTRSGLPNAEVTALFLTRSGKFLVKTRNAGLVEWKNGRFAPFVIADVKSGIIRDVYEDRDGNLWIGSGAEGLIRVKAGHARIFDSADGLTSDAAVCFYEDRDGNLWVGTTAGGLNRFRDGSFQTFAKEEGLSADQTSSVIEDSLGDILVATTNGLNRLHGTKVSLVPAIDPQVDTWSMSETQSGNLLVGTSEGVVLSLKNGKLVASLSRGDGIPPYHISAVLQDRDDRVWLATRGGGLAKVAAGTTTLFTTADGLNSDSLFSLAEAPNGEIWIGGDNGLNRLSNGKLTTLSANGQLTGAVVLTLYYDSAHTLWIGTLSRGLFRFENDSFTHYTTKQGLADDTINSIVEDNERNLWIGTDHVIARLNRDDVDGIAKGVQDTLTPMLFGKADGIKSAETNAGSLPSAWRARDGRLWFPTNRGVVVVDPARLLLRSRPPLARIEEIRADETAIDGSQKISISAKARRLEILYTAPNLTAPERTRFRYRLDGFDDRWVEGGPQRSASYTNLAPGSYTFRVSAKVENGEWGNEEATLNFNVEPLFFQTWWFQLIVVVASLIFALLVYRLRVGWLHAQAAVMEERQRIGSEIHDSLAQGLSGIIFQIEAALLTMQPGIASTRITSARDLATASLDDARYSVWNLSPPALDQKSLGDSIPFMARQLAHGRVPDLEINQSGMPWLTGPEANHHIVMIAQEAVSNAIQHGHAQTIVITTEYMPDALRLSVVDNGSGFIPEQAGPGFKRGYGMRNMHHRADRLGAKLTVASEPGVGTRVYLTIPRLGRFRKIWHLLLGESVARIDR